MSFHDLHKEQVPLLLPNAWDVASAVAFVSAGFPAVGTTSFGLNAAHGAVDGTGRSRHATERLVRQLHGLPAFLSVDIENGYSGDPAEVADFVASLGVDGINLEDSDNGVLLDPDLHAAKIQAIRTSAPDVFINARVENYWLDVDATVPSVLERAMTYVDAGADGVFVPGATAWSDLEALAKELPVPLNVLVTHDLTLDQLGSLGVKRVSTGSLPYRAALDAALRVVDAVKHGRELPQVTSYQSALEQIESWASERTNYADL